MTRMGMTDPAWCGASGPGAGVSLARGSRAAGSCDGLLPERNGQQGPYAEQAGLLADDQGAILVLGIFMCVGLAGMLWYLAGIGDAIIYRERLQEASDATAFSGAVLLARGMNLIVFLNLVMACILAVRVALKVLLVVVTVLWVIFEILGKIPYTAAFAQPIASGLNTARSTISDILDNTKDAINNAIKGLNKVQTALGVIIPPAAVAGAYQVGTKYKPMVTFSAAAGPATVKGLPIEDDSPNVLCRHAGEMAGWMMFKLITFGFDFGDKWESKFAETFGKVIEKGGQFFCETGSGSGSAPDFSDEMKDLNSGACDDKGEGLQGEANKKESEYDAKCAEYHADCTSTGSTVRDGYPAIEPDQAMELQTKREEANAARSEADNFTKEQCEKDQNKESDEQLKEAMDSSGSNSGDSEGSEDLQPKKVDEDWFDGAPDGQVLSVAKGDDKILKAAPKIVQMGAWLQEDHTFKIPAAAQFSVAQAEFFYDCSGGWAKCLEDEPMWNFRWRARLHRFNFAEQSGLTKVLDVAFGAEAIVNGVGGLTELNNLTWGNGQLRMDLLDAATDDDPIIH